MKAAILLQGQSVSNVKDMDIFLGDRTLCAVNNFFTLIGLVDQSFDIVHVSSPDFYNLYCRILNYCAENCCKLVTSLEALSKVDTNNDTYIALKNKGMIEVSKYSSGNNKFKGYPKYNSLTALLLYLISNKYDDILIFGADGCGTEYYNQSGYSNNAIKFDTEIMNQRFWEEVEHIGIDRNKVSIINVNGKSKVTCFSEISYEEFKNNCSFV